METTPFEIRSSLNAKEGSALPGKTPAEPTAREAQPGENSLFAGMLGQKISEVALSESKPVPSTPSRGGKRPPASLFKETIPNGKPESAAGTRMKAMAGHDPRSSNIDSEPLRAVVDEIAPLPGPTDEISSSATGKRADLADEAEKSAIQASLEMTRHAMPLPATGEVIPQADLPMTGKSGHLSDAVPFVQADRLQAVEALEGDGDTSPAEKTFSRGSSSSALHGSVLLSSLQTDRFTVPKGDGTEQDFAKQAAKTPEPGNGRTRPENNPDLRQPVSSPQDLSKQAEKSKELASIAAAPQEPDSGDAAAGLHPPVPSTPDPGKRAGRPREGASLTAASQNTASVVQGREPAPEYTKPASFLGQPLPAGDAVAETAGPARDRLNRNTTASHAGRQTERDILPFGMEMTNIPSPQGSNAPATAGSTGIEMQAVIDQLVEARQAFGNDSGRIRIVLTPPNLGTVDLDIVVRGERVEVVMTAENPTVQQALQSRGDDIRIALQRQDLKIEGFQVLLQDNPASQQQADGGSMYRQNRENREGFNAREDVAPPLPFLSPLAGATSAAGRVSIFA